LSFYKQHPLTCDSNDFWGQVKRTVNGKPVPREQIQMIVDAVQDGLALGPEDHFLDLCCGNGALSTFFFAACGGGLGVDFSEPLIETAKANFEQPPNFIYQLSDVLDYANNEPQPERFTKALCYGSFQYLAKDAAEALLAVLRRRFVGLRRLYLGNLPDRQRMGEFFRPESYTPGVEDDPGSPIGVWRARHDIAQLASQTGWVAEFRIMPGDFYAAHYRFDAILRR